MTPPDRAALVLFGCGKMGGAMLEGWIEQGLDPARIVVIDPAPSAPEAVGARFGVHVAADVADCPDAMRAETVLLAVKPQMMDAVLDGAGRFAADGSLMVSIAAGKPIAYFESAFGADARIVRCMPNTPAAVRRGMTVLCANVAVDADGRARAEALLDAVGETAWVEDETMLDAVTALSGGGPAYVFLLTEALGRAGAASGLPADLAARLARVTVAGSGALLDAASEDAAILRKNVTSPGGTTAEALRVLMGGDPDTADGTGGWQPLIDAAIAAAAKRSRELAG
jgi:pyrroline-5-carboxylate reductase